jgi:hypothetical protein
MTTKMYFSVLLVVIGSTLLCIASIELWSRLLLKIKHKASLFVICGAIGLLLLSYGVYCLNMTTIT